MKLFVVAADAACPEYIFDKKHLFPTLCSLINNGATSRYAGYVQRGYHGSYSSEQNWASIYTGLTPDEHAIGAHQGVQEVMPVMKSFNGLRPFWQELNRAGISVGLWQADCLDDPIPVDGYVVSAHYAPIFTPSENREAKRTVQTSDKRMLAYLNGDPPPRLYPRALWQQGLTFEQLQSNPAMVDKVANEANFQPMLDNFQLELDYWFGAMKRAQRERPVDVVWWFTPTTDILPHFSLWCDNNPVLIKAYQMLDNYLGDFLLEFSPENVVFLSDHGQQNFREIVKCSDPQVAREAFSARDKAVWMKNGYIALEALNGGLLFTTHALEGVFIANGKSVRPTEVKDMRTVDIYPTLLEMMGIVVPAGRCGYVVDIFSKPLQNPDRILRAEKVQYRQVALIQTHEVSAFDIIISELYYALRFREITIIGDPKYEEIFLGNPRVKKFLPFERFKSAAFDEIYCGFYNRATGAAGHIRLK